MATENVGVSVTWTYFGKILPSSEERQIGYWFCGVPTMDRANPRLADGEYTDWAWTGEPGRHIGGATGDAGTGD